VSDVVVSVDGVEVRWVIGWYSGGPSLVVPVRGRWLARKLSGRPGQV
jgi:hypothetical protein